MSTESENRVLVSKEQFCKDLGKADIINVGNNTVVKWWKMDVEVEGAPVKKLETLAYTDDGGIRKEIDFDKVVKVEYNPDAEVGDAPPGPVYFLTTTAGEEIPVRIFYLKFITPEEVK